MANLEFCDKHNMVSYLKKPTGSEGFQEIVDFLNGSHIRYAFTKNPTIYVFLIEKFWQTSTIRTVDKGEQEITAIVDGKEFTITEASVRRHLHLADVDGISVLSTTEIFDQLSLMGYVLTDDKLNFQKGKFSPQWRFLIHTIVTELPQTSEPIPNVPDEVVCKEWDDRVERATTTAASLDVEQTSGVTLVTPTQGEDQPEDHLGVLSAAKVLAHVAKINVHTYTRRRRAVSIGSGGISTTEESFSIAGASMPVSTAGMVQEVNISIPSPVVVKEKEELDEEERQWMARFHKAAQSFTKEEWENIKARVEADEELSRRLQAKERNKYSEVDQAKMLVDLINQRKKYFAAQKAKAKRNKPMTQAQQRNYMINYIKHMGSHTLQQLKIYSFDELKELFENTMRNVTTFVPMEIEDRGRASELAARSSQTTIIDSAEVGSSKRAAEAEFD
ncbi:hypothetical protein Tco_0966801 [Tanacetum coccineum]